MRQINANEVLDYGMLGTSGSQLARKFESARLVNVDDMTLKRLLDNPELSLDNNVTSIITVPNDWPVLLVPNKIFLPPWYKELASCPPEEKDISAKSFAKRDWMTDQL